MATVTQLHPELIDHKTRVLVSLDVHLIQSMERDELLMLQSALGYGDIWGQWVAPKTWCPPGPLAVRSITCGAVGSQDGDRVWMETLRICLLLSLVRGPKKHAGPITVCVRGRSALRMGLEFVKASALTTTWWSRASSDDYRERGSHVDGLCSVIQSFYRRGLLPDQPAYPPMDDSETELDRQGQPTSSIPVDKSKQWQPLPDEFTGACGQRVLWMVRNIGPALIDCFEACVTALLPPPRNAALKTPGQRTKGSEAGLLGTVRSEIVRGWSWRTADGKLYTDIPYQLSFRTRAHAPRHAKKSGDPQTGNFSWPPRTWGDVLNLVGILQTCHAWLLFLSSGPRSSTVLSFTTQSLVQSPQGYRLRGTLYKPPTDIGGRKRDWPLPPVLVNTVNQQIRLSNLVKRFANMQRPETLGDHLWVQICNSGKATNGGRGRAVTNMNQAMDRLVKVFGIRHLLGNDNPHLHTHRFRKTIARILALALTNAQMVLMDTFGHDDPEMTLGYMLSDKAIVDDALRMQRELVILMAKDAIDNAEQLGGAMGEVVRSAKQRYLRVNDKSNLAPEDSYELADQLTLGGRDWVYVMEGVICTLPQLSTGPCALKQHGRNPMNCQSGCDYQLLEELNKTWTDDMIAFLLTQLQRAVDDEADMLVTTLAAQLNNHLYRWMDVWKKWANHPLVKKYGDPKMTLGQIAA